MVGDQPGVKHITNMELQSLDAYNSLHAMPATLKFLEHKAITVKLSRLSRRK